MSGSQSDLQLKKVSLLCCCNAVHKSKLAVVDSTLSVLVLGDRSIANVANWSIEGGVLEDL